MGYTHTQVKETLYSHLSTLDMDEALQALGREMLIH